MKKYSEPFIFIYGDDTVCVDSIGDDDGLIRADLAMDLLHAQNRNFYMGEKKLVLDVGVERCAFSDSLY